VLPSEKRKTKIISKNKQTTKVLSKKLRKRLEKIVEKKKKKIEVSKLGNFHKLLVKGTHNVL